MILLTMTSSTSYHRCAVHWLARCLARPSGSAGVQVQCRMLDVGANAISTVGQERGVGLALNVDADDDR